MKKTFAINDFKVKIEKNEGADSNYNISVSIFKGKSLITGSIFHENSTQAEMLRWAINKVKSKALTNLVTEVKNTVLCIDTEYLTSNRSIDKLLLKCYGNDDKLFFSFNDKGLEYTLFTSVLDLSKHIAGEKCGVSFKTEDAMDIYLSKV